MFHTLSPTSSQRFKNKTKLSLSLSSSIYLTTQSYSYFPPVIIRALRRPSRIPSHIIIIIKNLIFDERAESSLIGTSLSEPLTYSTAVQNPPDIYNITK